MLRIVDFPFLKQFRFLFLLCDIQHLRCRFTTTSGSNYAPFLPSLWLTQQPHAPNISSSVFHFVALLLVHRWSHRLRQEERGDGGGHQSPENPLVEILLRLLARTSVSKD